MSPVELFSLCPTFNSYVIGVLFLFLVTFISCLLSMFVPMHELSYKYCRIFLFPVCRQCIYTELVLQIKINRTSHDTKSRPSMFYIRKARTLRMNKVILTSKREMLCNFYLQTFVIPFSCQQAIWYIQPSHFSLKRGLKIFTYSGRFDLKPIPHDEVCIPSIPQFTFGCLACKVDLKTKIV